MPELNPITFESNILDNTTYISEIIICCDTWCSTHNFFGTDRGAPKKARGGARSIHPLNLLLEKCTGRTSRTKHLIRDAQTDTVLRLTNWANTNPLNRV